MYSSLLGNNSRSKCTTIDVPHFSLMVSRIHTVKNVSHLMDLSGKELIHDKLIHESMGKSPSKDQVLSVAALVAVA